MTLSRDDRNRLQQAKFEARERVIQRGIVEFRADADLMDQLLQISDFKKTPVGTLVRQWIAPIVSNELRFMRKEQRQKASVNIDESLLEKAVFFDKRKSKRETINQALQEYIKRRQTKSA